MSTPVKAEEATSASPLAVDTKPQTELAADGVQDSIQRIASNSAVQIDAVIAKLTELRGRLQLDGEHVQHEIVRVQNKIAGYMETNDAVIDSMTQIRRAMAQFNRNVNSDQPH